MTRTITVSGCRACPFADRESISVYGGFSSFCEHPVFDRDRKPSPPHPFPLRFEDEDCPRPDWCPLPEHRVEVVAEGGDTHCHVCGHRYGDGTGDTVEESSIGDGCVECYVHR